MSKSKRDIYYSTKVLDEMITICNYMKDNSVREVRTWSDEVAAFFNALDYEVNDGYISRKQEEIPDLGCYW